VKRCATCRARPVCICRPRESCLVRTLCTEDVAMHVSTLG
jgi:hypothetical protein